MDGRVEIVQRGNPSKYDEEGHLARPRLRDSERQLGWFGWSEEGTGKYSDASTEFGLIDYEIQARQSQN